MQRLLRYMFITSIIVCIVVPVLHVVSNWSVEKRSCVYTQPSRGWRPFEEEQSSRVENIQALNRALPHSEGSCESAILIINHLKRNPILKVLLRVFQAQRINHDVYSVPFTKGTVPNLVTQEDEMIGKYCIILVLDMFEYVSDGSIYQLFEEYCAKFGASLIFMVQDSGQIHYKDLKLYSLPKTTSLLKVHEGDDFEYVRNGGLWRWSGQDGLLFSAHVIKDLVLAVPSIYKPLGSDRFLTLVSLELNTSHHLPLSFIDWKSSDNIIKGYIGMPIDVPLTKLVLLEMIRLLARDILKFHNQRWIQIDIDDMFVAPKGLKPTAADVKVSIMYYPNCGIYLAIVLFVLLMIHQIPGVP